MRHFPAAQAALAFALLSTLAGCGNGGSPAAGTAGETRGVITSSADCVSFGPKAVDACAAALETAVGAHEAASPSYTNLQACETAAGAGNCERAESGKYRRRLLAFLVTASGETARAEPLYAAKDGAVGFQTASSSVVLASDAGVAFSSQALTVAEMQAGGRAGKSSKMPKL